MLLLLIYWKYSSVIVILIKKKLNFWKRDIIKKKKLKTIMCTVHISLKHKNKYDRFYERSICIINDFRTIFTLD